MNLYILAVIISVIALFTGEDDFASPELILWFFLFVMILHVGLEEEEIFFVVFFIYLILKGYKEINKRKPKKANESQRKHLDKQFIKNMFLLKKNVFFCVI
jgi:predicted membrane protein